MHLLVYYINCVCVCVTSLLTQDFRFPQQCCWGFRPSSGTAYCWIWIHHVPLKHWKPFLQQHITFHKIWILFHWCFPYVRTDCDISEFSFFGIFTKKHCKSMLISTATSFSLHAATWKPLNGISWNLVFKSFTEICQDTIVFIEIGLRWYTLDMYIYMQCCA